MLNFRQIARAKSLLTVTKPTTEIWWKNEAVERTTRIVPTTSDDGTRIYKIIPAGEKSRSYPSVTTVLSAMSDDTWLQDWRHKVGEEEASRRSTYSAWFGTLVHKLVESVVTVCWMGETAGVEELACVEYLSSGNLTEFAKTYEHTSSFRAARAIGSFSGSVSSSIILARGIAVQILSLLNESVESVVFCEHRLFSDRLRIGGTTDMVAVIDGKMTIIDFKTYARAKDHLDDAFTQLSLYAQMINDTYDCEPVEQLMIIQSNENNPCTRRDARRVDYIERAENIVGAYHLMYGDSST